MPRASGGSFPDIARWFQESVVGPHEQGRKRPRLAPASTVIRPSQTLKPEQRVGIYAEAYLARLIEALHDDFPAVTRFLGHQAFHEMARAYLEKFPSRSWSLNPLGRRLPEFLAMKVRVPKCEPARALAAVEVAMAEVFDGTASTPLGPADFARLDAVKFFRAKLDFVPTFRLVEVDYAVNPYIDAVRQEKDDVPALKKKTSWIAIYRKDFKVWRLDLQQAAYATLSELQRGRTVSIGVAAAARIWKGKPDDLPTQLQQWFGEWSSEGFFRDVRYWPKFKRNRTAGGISS
ncbi:MAG TPA: DNA-binding domain-containing protein [Planctomycetota bacterium]|nr:DNA-binding domain-containing protein [Planctomycetota bacterium]